MSAVPTSPARSAEGWSFRLWFARNKSSVKTIVSLAVAFTSTYVAAIKPAELQILVASILGVGARLLLDWLDFYFSEVPLA